MTRVIARTTPGARVVQPGIGVTPGGTRYSLRTGLPIRTRRSRGYYERKAAMYQRLAREDKALGRKVAAKLHGTLAREFRQKAKRAALHGRKR